jgi:isocitrate dehydrogenase (NAD+)
MGPLGPKRRRAMAHKVTLIPGDGIGPEVTKATKRVLEATGVKFYWDLAIAGDSAQDMFGTPLPDCVLDSISRNKVALKGPITTPVGHGFRSVNVALRRALDLYTCLRPCKTYPGVPTFYQGVDIVIVRENTEDLYRGIEFEEKSPGALKLTSLISEVLGEEIRKDSGFSIKMISETGTRRIAKFAFEYARDWGRKKVTAVHKANIMRSSDGLFLSIAREVAKEYPDIEFDDIIIDTLCMQLVRHPQQIDILLLPNLYGDFISELCAGLIGGLGLAPGANIGDEIAVFEPTHGSAPKYTGQNKVNPMAMMLSGVMMLRYLGENEAAQGLETAIVEVLTEGKDATYDLMPNPNPAVGTSQVADAVIAKLEEGSYAE